MKNTREKCVLCGDKLSPIFNLEMPVYMGIMEDNESPLFEDMIFCECEGCGEVQMGNLIDLNILYKENHNNGIVGKTWLEHYNELVDFIGEDISGKSVLEISDPSAKIAKLCEGFSSWLIIEPNPENITVPNVEFVKAFFDENLDVDKCDVIIHSHLLEHIYEPIDFMRLCNKTLNEDGIMVMSIPNLESILNSEYSPNNALHFEHTYYINDDVIRYLAEVSGFMILDKYNYVNHSTFYKLAKVSERFIESDNIGLDGLNKKFNNSLMKHTNSINEINKEIGNYKDVYIFGSHVSTQFYISKGIDENTLRGTLDNSPSKVGKRLYGTELMTYNPEIIKGLDSCLVICSHAGIYYEEISKQLKGLNKNVTII